MAKLDPALWRHMMAHLHQKHAAICRRWFDELHPVELNGGLLQIKTSNSVQMNYLQARCRRQFTEAAQAATGALVMVRFVDRSPELPAPRRGGVRGRQVDSSATLVYGPAAELPAWEARASPVGFDEADQRLTQTILSPDYSFENFVTGPGNRLAHAAAWAVANQPGMAYNPLFIHGGVGLGKTHLLQAISQKILQEVGQQQICYLSCDAFVNQFLTCVQKGQMSQFRHMYRHVDMLVIDDIHFLANRERTQEEFFHTFNELFQSKRQIVLSSDSPPAEIPQLEERLVSRFQSGMVAPISKPSYETRVAILRAKTSLRDLHMPDDVVSYIATKIDTNARELEGAINTIQGHATLKNVSIDLLLAQEALSEPALGVRRSQVTFEQILELVTAAYNVKLSALQSRRRQKSISAPRQVGMYLARKHTRFSLEQIGGYFGGRDHTTVMHALKVIEQRLDEDAGFARQIEQLDMKITDGQHV